MIDIIFRQGTAAQVAAFTGAAGTLVLDTENIRLFVHDGETIGGFVVDHDVNLDAIRAQLASLAIADIDGLELAISNYALLSEMGGANGLVQLDGTGKVPEAQLPEYVRDVMVVATLPGSGEAGKLYITNESRVYRWTGSVWFEIKASPASTDILTEGVSNFYLSDEHVGEAFGGAGDLTFDPETNTFGLAVPPVTAATAGLGNVQNYGMASQAESEAMTSNLKYITPLRMRQILLKMGLSWDADNSQWVMDEGKIGFILPMEPLTGTSTDFQAMESIPLPIVFYGTTAQNDALTLEKGQMSVDTDKDLLRIHDGVTQGGFELRV